MKKVPFEAAKDFCEQYEKNQCVILSWDKESQKLCMTTYIIDDDASISSAHAECSLPEGFESWQIERVDRYYYQSGRNHNTWIETTYWYETHTMKRIEKTRTYDGLANDTYNMPDWAKGITERRRLLENSRAVC